MPKYYVEGVLIYRWADGKIQEDRTSQTIDVSSTNPSEFELKAALLRKARSWGMSPHQDLIDCRIISAE